MPSSSQNPDPQSSFQNTNLTTTTHDTTSIAGNRILSDSRSANVLTGGRAPNPTKEDSLTSTDLPLSNNSKRSSSVLSHKRSVKSITKEYEVRQDTVSSALHLRPPLSTSRPSSPTYCASELFATTSNQQQSQSLDVPHTPALQKRNSFLLPSNSDPTTLTATPPRPRSLSSSSGATSSRSPSIRLASGSYPSTLRPPVNKASNSSIRSLPEPPLPLPQVADKSSQSSRATSPINIEETSAPEAPATAVTMSTSQEETSAVPVSPPTQDPKEAAEHVHKHNAALEQNSVEDEALYEGMDSITDLDGPAGVNGTGLSASSVDFSKMTLAERREHSRRHSHIHSRNLSVFFPRPGTEAEAESDAVKAREHFEQQQPQRQDVPPASAASTSSATGTNTSSSDSKVHRRGNSGNRPQITVSTDASTLSPRSASFAALTANQNTTTNDNNKNSHSKLGAPDHHLGGDLSPSPTKSRRGHHHRHSVAMLDSGLSPIAANKQNGGHGMERSTSSTSWNSDVSYSAPFDDHHHSHNHSHSHNHDSNHSHIHSHGHKHRRSLHVRTVSALGHIPQASRPLLLFGISHFGLGAALWMAGQEVDSLSATGLGYLVVFDAMGILSSALSDWALEWEQHASDQRRRSGKTEGTTMKRPYGMHRVSTLLHFVQTIYLLFASVYVLKESVEHALLEGGGSSNVIGAEGGLVESASGHDHSHAHAEHPVGILMPNLLLALSLAACVFSNIVMGNHARLVAACGISTAASGGAPGGPRHGRSGSVLMRPSELASPLLALLANPFSLTVLFFSSALLFAGLTMPSIQVAALDKVLAGLESVSMFYVAYPASVALGKVLLQTAPPESSPNKQQLKRALKLVEQHPLISYVPPPNLWQLTPPTSALVQADRGSGMLSGGGASGRGMHFGSKTASLVASVTVFLRAEATDEDCFEMTKWVWEKLAPSVGAGRGLMAGEMLRGTQRAGELTVCVKREGHEEDGAQHSFGGGCGHGHGHSHDHGHHDHIHHSHDHHGHGHGHGHAASFHDHSHGHNQGHHHHH
ncbi:uncharacterized protein UTRI_06348 [Ustilago trichophora]|uniref:Cation efflux protein transmembrane domain-containing protein n=1 Tax=Ustilago trichophora TaxID=86804 RepID=A0A5C3EIM5_9BASI|nr:uncharacterized protein UTRI_06348 [Ustilago trichophora]